MLCYVLYILVHEPQRIHASFYNFLWFIFAVWWLMHHVFDIVDFLLVTPKLIVVQLNSCNDLVGYQIQRFGFIQSYFWYVISNFEKQLWLCWVEIWNISDVWLNSLEKMDSASGYVVSGRKKWIYDEYCWCMMRKMTALICEDIGY